MDIDSLKVVKYLTSPCGDGELINITKKGFYDEGMYIKTAKQVYKIKENIN